MVLSWICPAFSENCDSFGWPADPVKDVLQEGRPGRPGSASRSVHWTTRAGRGFIDLRVQGLSGLLVRGVLQ